MAYDIKISGGTIIDGTGAPRYAGSVGIRDGRIVALGVADESAHREIKADGRVISPGFVDIHTHYDAQVIWDNQLTASPWHGVTTAVMGNCGFTVAPTRPEHRDMIVRLFERVEGMSYDALTAGLGKDWGFVSYPEYLDAVEKARPGINVASFVGHSALRLFVMGEAAAERSATDAEIAAMKGMLDEALEAGAIGLSTSTCEMHFGFSGKPVPSRLAEPRELLALAEVLGRRGAGMIEVAASRMIPLELYENMAKVSGRNLCFTAVLGNQLGPTGHRRALDAAAKAIAAGVGLIPQTSARPMMFEFNLAEPLGLQSWVAIKPVLAAKSAAEKLRLYADPEFRRAFRAMADGPGEHDNSFSGGLVEGNNQRTIFQATEISWFPPDPSLEGRRVADLAKESGKHIVDALLDLAIASDLSLRVKLVTANYDDSVLEDILRDPNIIVGLGDAGAHVSQLCDACYTTDFLRKWVREKQVFSLERGVQMLTSRNADTFGLKDRGRLAVGRPADIVVFDPDQVAAGKIERVFDQPAGADRLVSKPRGIGAVLVNGVMLPPPGESFKEAPPGKLLRGGKVPG